MYKKAFECCTSEDCDCQKCPLYDFGETQLDCKTELLRKIKPTTVYEVKTEWTRNYDQGCYTAICSTEEKAKEIFLEEVQQAKEDYSDAFDENGEVEDGWVLEKYECEWELYVNGFYNADHCTITITEKEIID